MAELIKTKGIVIHVMSIKDHDKRIILFSKEYGKMVVFANGAKRSKSPLLAGTQPFVFGEFHMMEGRNSYTLRSVDISETFYNIRNDMNTLAYGLYLLEIVNSVIQEMDPNEDLLRLLYISLAALKTGSQSGAVIRSAFELRSLNSLGFAPDLTGCMECGETEGSFTLLTKGGIVCSKCRMNKKHQISYEGLKALQYIQGAPLKKLYHFKITEDRLGEISHYINDYFKSFIPNDFKSLEILE